MVDAPGRALPIASPTVPLLDETHVKLHVNHTLVVLTGPGKTNDAHCLLPLLRRAAAGIQNFVKPSLRSWLHSSLYS